VDVGRSTTVRADAGQWIHLSFTADDGVAWAGEELLDKVCREEEWVVFEVDGRGVQSRVLRDPASQTGYILEAPAVAREFVRGVRRWRPLAEVTRASSAANRPG
jgi:hypothetical protein